MATAGQFVRERIPIPTSVPEAGRLVLELISSSRDSQAETAGPMTFRVVRRYRPTWATLTGFLVFPLFVRTTEVCRVAVIEARIGAELLLEGAIDPDLHHRLVQLGRVPEAARVSTLGPRPVPQVLSPPAAAGMPQEAGQMPVGPSRDARHPGHAAQQAPDVLDLREEHRPARPRDEFANLVPPPLLPTGSPAAATAAPGPPGGPAPQFAPMEPERAEAAPPSNGSNGGRLPSAFRSPRDAAQPGDVLAPPPAHGHSSYEAGWAPVPAAPHMPPNDLFTPGAAAAPGPSYPPPGEPVTPGPQRLRASVDTGESAEITRLLIVGRAPTRQPHESDAGLLTVNDPSLSVSKIHLTIETDGVGLWVIDRNSTNGTWIDEGRGALRPVPANQRTAVPQGARVLIGERVITFTREPL